MTGVKIEKVFTRKRYIINNSTLRAMLGIPKGEHIRNFGCWAGRSPMEVSNGVSSDVEEYYIETEDGDDD